MLHSFGFSNFQSFRDRAEVSLVLNNKAPRQGWECVAPSEQRLSTVLGVVGGNGAGKTALLKPLAFVAWFVAESFRAKPSDPIPVTPHFTATNEPTEIEVEFEDKQGVIWRYVLSATTEKVLHESLHKKQERFGYVFRRDWNESIGAYDIKQQGFGLSPSEARKVRPNASLISTAAQYGVELAQRFSSLRIASNVSFHGRKHFEVSQLSSAAHLFSRSEALRKQMSTLLAKWDLGLADINIREAEHADGEGVLKKYWTAFGVHQSHGQTIELEMNSESSGTQSAFVLLARLLTVLELGGLALIDELDSDLHPHMLEPILDLFANPATNRHNAQLIFTCHTPEILDLLQKSQIVFVEKNQCDSTAYRGDEIRGLRSDDNLRAKYMAGALGAVPQL